MSQFEDEAYNGVYVSYMEFDSNEEAFFPEIVVNNRPVFRILTQDTRNDDKCIWWHEYKHWWMGPCSSVGDEAGHAYLDPDENCPFLSEEASGFQWRRGSSNEFIVGKSQSKHKISPSNTAVLLTIVHT